MDSGYVRVLRPDHPLADGNGWVREHRMNAWDAGLFDDPALKIHHVDEDKTNNDTTNLEPMTAVEHGRRHGGRFKLDRDLAARLYLSGLSTTAVAERMGTHAGKVSRMLAEVGVPARR